MKNFDKLLIVISLVLPYTPVFGQFIRAPKQGAIYQRNNNNVALVPVAGQVFGGVNPGSYQVACYARRVDGNNNIITGAPTYQATFNAPKGIFNGTIPLSKGWYQIRLVFTEQSSGQGVRSDAIIYTGVGDVFVVAGQSNGQGVTGMNFSTPNSIATPEFVRGLNISYQCSRFTPNQTVYSLAQVGPLGPAGNSRWCYEVLGKQISDANADGYSGMPVAFFNTCSGGSSVKNWSDGANGDRAISPYSGIGWCEGYYSDIQDQNYYRGQPYLTLKSTLNWYAQQYGIRAILWHQGEADADPGYTSPMSAVTNAADYSANLSNVIQKSRDHLGRQDLAWMIARVSLSSSNLTGGTSSPNSFALKALNGQANTINTGNNILQGPFTDQYNGNSTVSYRPDNTHFSEANSQGLTLLANMWAEYLSPASASSSSLTRIEAASVPNVSITGSGSTFTLSAEAGDGYCWVSGYPDDYEDAPPASASGCYSTNQSITVNSATGYYRCYIRKGLNWQSTAAILPRIDCSNCRTSAESEPIENQLGINFNVYPNPVETDIKIEFDVPRDRTSVRVEIFDLTGKSIKLITAGTHAKGHFTYPITGGLPSDGTYICQLMVGEVFLSRKIVQVR